jgi:hypothetical protein
MKSWMGAKSKLLRYMGKKISMGGTMWWAWLMAICKW